MIDVPQMPPMPHGRVYEVDEVDEEALKKSFQEAHRSFYELIGYHVTRWAAFDRELLNICQLVLRIDMGVAAVIFYRSPNLSDHLALSHKLLEIALNDDRHLSKRWSKLKDRIDEGSQIRNYIAHQPIAQRGLKTIYPGPNDSKNAKIKIEEAVLFIYNEFLKPKRAKWDYIGPDELRAACKEADKLYVDLLHFMDDLRSALKAPPV